MSLTPVGDLGIALKADIDDYQKSVATAKDVTGGLTSSVRSLGSAMRSMGAAMTVAAGIAGAALVSLSQKAEQVSASFREVDTLMGEGSDAQERYGELVSDLNTKFGLQADKMEVIEGLYQSISAGVDKSVQSQREFLETASELAVVGRVELGTAVDVLSTVMNIYSMEADQAENVSESLFQTVIFGKTRMEELAPVLGRVAALGSNLGVQIDEIGASMGVLTRTGFGARVAATGLRNIFRSMLKPGEAMQNMLFDIASEQDFFAEQIEGSTQRVKNLAATYRNASDSLEKFSEKQAQARATQESASTAIQEARLKISAINEGRLNQLPKLTNAQVEQANSVSELESIIDSYQFKVNKARLQEKRFRNEQEKAQKTIKESRTEIADLIASSGNLQGGIGQLILENQNFVDTMVDLREKVNNTDTSMSDLFPRTRALQGALALVGEEGQMLRDIFKEMEEGSFDAREEWNKLSEAAQSNFESFQEFKKATDDVTAGDLDQWFEKATGPQQKMRNAISELNESLSQLGQTFTKDVVNSIQSFADSFASVVDTFDSMEKSVRENISRFAVLATSIGLVLGPILFLTGQIIVMASVMGTSLLPLLIAVGGAFGLLAGGLSTAMQGGNEAETMFVSLSNVFDSIIDSLSLIVTHFRGIVVPALTFLGNVFVDVFQEIKSQFEDTEGLGSFENMIVRLMFAVREVVSVFASFIDNNKELIASLITLAAGTIVNKIIPAIITIASAIRSALIPIFNQLANYVRGDLIPTLIEFLPSIDQIVNAVVTGLIPALSKIITKGQGEMLPAFKEIVRVLLTQVGPALVSMLPALQKLTRVVVNSIIPAAGDLFKAFLSIAKNINWSGIASSFSMLVGVIIALIPPAMKVVSLLAGFVEWLSPLISGIISVIAIFAPWIVAIVKVVGVLITLYGIITTVISVVSGIVSWIALWAGVLGTTVGVILGVVGAVIAFIGFILLLRTQIIGLANVILNYAIDVLNILWDLLTGDIGFKEAGERWIKSLAKGIKNGIKYVKSAANEIADTVMAFWPSSPAEKGPFSKEPPKELGGNIGEGLAKGLLDKKGKAGDASGEFASGMDFDFSDTDVEEPSPTDTDMSDWGKGMGKKGLPGGMGAMKDITIEEGAIEVGPFHGISDEELPQEVKEQVDRSLQDIIEEIKGAGQDSTNDLAPGGQSGL